LIGATLQSGERIELMPDMETTSKSEPQNIAAFYTHALHPRLIVRAVIDY
jgi:hypothetical protein